MNRYHVYTQHQRASFIVPIEIEADTPYDAAVQRWEMLADSSKEGTFALLVVAQGYEAHLFPVMAEARLVSVGEYTGVAFCPTVAEEPLAV